MQPSNCLEVRDFQTMEVECFRGHVHNMKTALFQ